MCGFSLAGVPFLSFTTKQEGFASPSAVHKLIFVILPFGFPGASHVTASSVSLTALALGSLTSSGVSSLVASSAALPLPLPPAVIAKSTNWYVVAGDNPLTAVVLAGASTVVLPASSEGSLLPFTYHLRT